MPPHDDQPAGKLRAHLNPNKASGDKRPAFEGTIELPGHPHPRQLALWVKKDKTGDPILVGHAGEGAREQIAALAEPHKAPAPPLDDGKQFAIDPYDVMLFSRKGAESKGPDYWGYYHPGSDAPLMKLAVWAKTDRDGKAVLSGSVKVHTRDRSPDQNPDDAPDFAPARKRSRDRSR